jgi:clan AA aspartic protease (TIGR02281 family)
MASIRGKWSGWRMQSAPEHGGFKSGVLPQDATMHRLFTVRWPLLARLEAFLLFVAILAIWNRNPVLHPVLEDLSSVEAGRIGISKSLLSWGVLVFLAAGPYLGAMMAVDRVLRVRNGLAVLSLLAIAIWAALGAIFAPDVAALLPLAWVGGARPLSFTHEAVIAAASIGLLIHARPLSQGLVGRSPVTPAPMVRSGGRWPNGAVQADPVPNPWGAPDPRSAADRPRSEGAGGILLAGLIGAFAMVMLSWRYEFERPASIVGMQDEKLALPRVSAPTTSPDAWAQVVAPGERQPMVSTSGPMPASLPRVWTPVGEAAAVRRPDGFFGVAAMVNNQPMSMLFDTGASSVTLRAEDAVRLGIDVGALRFSIQSRTANGTASMAPVTIDTMSIGPIVLRNVPAVVAKPGTLQENLLGQSFLVRLRDYSVESDRVIFHGN